jgi:hypothetical protein
VAVKVDLTGWHRSLRVRRHLETQTVRKWNRAGLQQRQEEVTFQPTGQEELHPGTFYHVCLLCLLTLPPLFLPSSNTGLIKKCKLCLDWPNRPHFAGNKAQVLLKCPICAIHLSLTQFDLSAFLSLPYCLFSLCPQLVSFPGPNSA